MTDQTTTKKSSIAPLLAPRGTGYGSSSAPNGTSGMGGGEGELIVTLEMRRGYTLGGRVIRPAMVGVADDAPEED